MYQGQLFQVLRILKEFSPPCRCGKGSYNGALYYSSSPCRLDREGS
jgi:hypothetical protein